MCLLGPSPVGLAQTCCYIYISDLLCACADSARTLCARAACLRAFLFSLLTKTSSTVAASAKKKQRPAAARTAKPWHLLIGCMCRRTLLAALATTPALTISSRQHLRCLHETFTAQPCGWIEPVCCLKDHSRHAAAAATVLSSRDALRGRERERAREGASSTLLASMGFPWACCRGCAHPQQPTPTP